MVIGPLVVSCLLLGACSGEDKAEKKKIDYASFGDAAVNALVDEGKYKFAIEIIKGQADLGVADAQDYLTLARIYLEVQNGIAAEVALEKAVAKGADKDRLGLSVARALFLQDKLPDAKKALETATLTSDEEAEAHLLQGDIANAMGDTGGARYHYRAAVLGMPKDFRGHLSLALFELGQGNLAVAGQEADLAASLSTDKPLVAYAQGMVARYAGKNDAALAHLARAAELQPSNLLAHLEMAGLYIDEGKREEAQKQLDAVYALSPQHPVAHYYTALLLAQTGELQKAQELLLRTGDLTKTYPPAARAYGLVAYQLGNYSTAEPYLTRYLDVAPSDRLARLALAESLAHRGKPNEALQELAPLLGKEGKDREAYMQAAAAAAAAGDIRTARSFYQTASGLEGANKAETPADRRLLAARTALAQFLAGDMSARDRLQALYQDGTADDEGGLIILGNMQLQSGDLAGAGETAKKMAAAGQETAAGYNLLGAIRFREGRYDEALTAYTKALGLNPAYQSARKNRGLAYLAAGKYDLAREDLTGLAASAPNDAQVQGMLGHALLELNRPKEALGYLKEARTKIPQSASIATDYAEALAESGLMSAALDEAHAALKLAKDRVDLVKYLSGLIDTWQKAEDARKEAEDAARVKAREEVARQRVEQQKREEEARIKAAKEKLERAKAAKERAEAEKAAQAKEDANRAKAAAAEKARAADKAQDSGSPEKTGPEAPKAPDTPETPSPEPEKNTDGGAGPSR